MSKHIVEIRVTESFVCPPELEGHTPEFGDNLLNTGFAGLKFGYDCVAKETNEIVQKKHEAEVKRLQEEAEKQRLKFENVIQILNDRNKMLEVRLSDKQDMSSTQEAEIRKRAISETESRMNDMQAELTRMRKELAESREREDNARRDERMRGDEHNKAIQTELAEKKTELAEIKTEFAETKKRLEQLKLNRANPSVKGNIFEGNVKQILEAGFPGSEFLSTPKQTESGDHIFKWDGLNIMVEDKSKKSFSKGDEDKLFRDMSQHNEIDVLIKICELPTTKASEWPVDVSMTDMRPTISINNFHGISDKVKFIEGLHSMIKLFAKLNKNKLSPSDEKYEQQQHNIQRIIRASRRYGGELRSNINDANACLRNIKYSAEQIDKILKRIQKTYAELIQDLTNDDINPTNTLIKSETTSSETDSDVSSTEAKPIPEPKTKTKKPKARENIMNFIKKPDTMSN